MDLVKLRIDQGDNAVQEWKKKGTVACSMIYIKDDTPIDLTHASFTFYTLRSFKNAFLVDTQIDAPKKNPSGVIATIKRWFRPYQTLESLDERVWTKLHPDTYVDEEMWRLWVPLPGACLGVTIEEHQNSLVEPATCRIRTTRYK